MFGCVKMLSFVNNPTVRSMPLNVLSFALVLVLAAVQQPQDCNSLHETGGRVSQELTAGLESAVNPDVVLGGHKEIARLGRMMGGLFRNIVSARAIGIVPVAGKSLSENRIQRLLHSTAGCQKPVIVQRWSNLRRLEMPSTQIELDHRNKPLDRIIDCGHGEEGIGVCHEAREDAVSSSHDRRQQRSRTW